MWVYLIEMMENAQIRAYACVNRINGVGGGCTDAEQESQGTSS